jgi:hypothetical protein
MVNAVPFPVLAGTGKQLFEGGNDQVPLRLVEARQHSNGVVALRHSGVRSGLTCRLRPVAQADRQPSGTYTEQLATSAMKVTICSAARRSGSRSGL